MTQNSKFAITILEKIGAPLAAALESVPLNVDNKDVEAAKLIAQMMGQAVQVSIALNNSLNITESEEQADSTRLALAAIAAPLIGEFYRQNARVPDEQDIKRIIKSQEAVLAFAENFSAADEGKSRLTTIDHSAPLFDKAQISLVVLQALNPVITAIFEFPFGQSEAKLLQEVADRLQANAAEIVQASGGDKLGEVMVIKALAQLYADCHRMETARLSTASAENRGDLSLNPVWDAYQTKVAMVEALLGSGQAANASVGGSSMTPAQQSQPSRPVAEVSPVAPQVPAASNSAPSSPMGFFKAGPKTEESAPPPATAYTTQTNITQAPAMPEVPPVQSVASIPSQPTQAPVQPSSPMGFFKPGVKKPDDNGESTS